MRKMTTKTEAEQYILGMITGLNNARLLVWGIGYDSDATALMIRRKVMAEIYDLKEILEIKNIGSSWFESAEKLLSQLEVSNE